MEIGYKVKIAHFSYYQCGWAFFQCASIIYMFFLATSLFHSHWGFLVWTLSIFIITLFKSLYNKDNSYQKIIIHEIWAILGLWNTYDRFFHFVCKTDTYDFILRKLWLSPLGLRRLCVLHSKWHWVFYVSDVLKMLLGWVKSLSQLLTISHPWFSSHPCPGPSLQPCHFPIAQVHLHPTPALLAFRHTRPFMPQELAVPFFCNFSCRISMTASFLLLSSNITFSEKPFFFTSPTFPSTVPSNHLSI